MINTDRAVLVASKVLYLKAFLSYYFPVLATLW